MTSQNFSRKRHYRKHVLHLPISESKYYEILDHSQLFREWLERLYLQSPNLFPNGFEHGFSFKSDKFYFLYGIRLRSIRLHYQTKRIFAVLPSFINIDINQDAKPKVYKSVEIIRFVLECEREGISLCESEFRCKHRDYYRSAIKLFGSWVLVLVTAGLSMRKAKSLCIRKAA